MWEYSCSLYWPRSTSNWFTTSLSPSQIISSSLGIYIITLRWCQLHGWTGINIRNQPLIYEKCNITLCNSCTVIKFSNITCFDTHFWGKHTTLKPHNFLKFDPFLFKRHVDPIFRQYRTRSPTSSLIFISVIVRAMNTFKIPVFAIFSRWVDLRPH